jgi:hydroxymethylglutaryl-CoA lyase
MKIIECPRDAMQGLDDFIPTDTKIRYLNTLLKVGFDTVDFGSFVSPRAVPQMRDTEQVLKGLELTGSRSSLLSIIANVRGAETASQFQEIDYLGFPLSISETFQQRNTNSSIAEAFSIVETCNSIADKSGQQMVVYISMGFGNPYGDLYNPDIVIDFCKKLREMGVSVISLADTTGIATEEDIRQLFKVVLNEFSDLEIGAHLHSVPNETKSKIQAVIDSGCTRMDGAIKGFGGCPMAKDDLTGNIATEIILDVLAENQIDPEIDPEAFKIALSQAAGVFPV